MTLARIARTGVIAIVIATLSMFLGGVLQKHDEAKAATFEKTVLLKEKDAKTAQGGIDFNACPNETDNITTTDGTTIGTVSLSCVWKVTDGVEDEYVAFAFSLNSNWVVGIQGTWTSSGTDDRENYPFIAPGYSMTGEYGIQDSSGSGSYWHVSFNIDATTGSTTWSAVTQGLYCPTC